MKETRNKFWESFVYLCILAGVISGGILLMGSAFQGRAQVGFATQKMVDSIKHDTPLENHSKSYTLYYGAFRITNTDEWLDYAFLIYGADAIPYPLENLAHLPVSRVPWRLSAIRRDQLGRGEKLKSIQKSDPRLISTIEPKTLQDGNSWRVERITREGIYLSR
jgi:hypothetical protein